MESASSAYPVFRASGSWRTLGRQHGEQAAARIRAFVDYLASSLNLSRDALRRRALPFREAFAAHCPHLLDEIGGLARGAGIDEADALAVQVRGELGPIAEGACTTFVIGRQGTARGQTLIGQTSDTPAEIEDFAYVLHLVPDDRPELILWTFGGMIGYHGLNARGVAHFANSLGGGPRWRRALPHYPLKRLLLECETGGQIVDALHRVPVCSNGNYVICDGAGAIFDVELTSEGPQFLDARGEGFFAHSNHFLCEPHACAENFAVSLPDSFQRLERMRERIQSAYGSITVDDLKVFLSDHAGFPASICRHPHEGPGNAVLPSTGKTVAALIAEPDAGRFHVARGNPCEHPFIEHRLNSG